MKKQIVALALVFAMATLGGCSLMATGPLDTLYYQQSEGAASTLVVFLRGIGGSHRSFAEEGLVAEVWERNLDADMAAPNAHFGYYSTRNLIERLHNDVITPAREAGYQEIWLVGVSMGGLGSLLYLRERPEDIDGVYLIAPFLGYSQIITSIEQAGGVESWKVPPYTPDDDWQIMIWDWIKTTVAPGNSPPVYLGYGRGDDYVKGQQLLQTVLPERQVLVIDGGHDYLSFKRLWTVFLDRTPFFRR